MRHPENPVLEMRQIRKCFPGVLALDDVSFDLRAGEVHVLLGENGAGKSTLMKILSGVYSKDGGEIRLKGESVDIRSPRQAIELGISTIFQEFNLIPELSACENIFLGREPEKVPGILDRRRQRRMAEGLLGEMGVSFDATIPVSRLSVAEQQMVEVAKALSVQSRILVMDEPTSALAKQETSRLFETIERLKEKGVAIIYISHRLEELFEIGDRVTVLRDGKRVSSCQLSDVSVQDLVRLMVNRELKDHFPRVRVEPGQELLRVENLSREGSFSDISLHLRSGEILGIAGLLGAGRTALAKAVFGAKLPNSGQVYVKGRPVEITSPAKAVRNGIGFLSEDRKNQGLILNLSVKKNISLTVTDRLSRFGVVSPKAETKLARRFVSKLRIKTPGVDQRVVSLSGGNQQKVVLSKWLARDSDILIFDEPTRGIDVGSKVEIYLLMNELTKRGAGIIMISSELPEILGMSDRILVMREGRIVWEVRSSEATQEGLLMAALGHKN